MSKGEHRMIDYGQWKPVNPATKQQQFEEDAKDYSRTMGFSIAQRNSKLSPAWDQIKQGNGAGVQAKATVMSQLKRTVSVQQ
jgi:hypothetical protein